MYSRFFENCIAKNDEKHNTKSYQWYLHIPSICSLKKMIDFLKMTLIQDDSTILLYFVSCKKINFLTRLYPDVSKIFYYLCAFHYNRIIVLCVWRNFLCHVNTIFSTRKKKKYSLKRKIKNNVILHALNFDFAKSKLVFCKSSESKFFADYVRASCCDFFVTFIRVSTLLK